jgi:hypothetical protein
MTAPNIDPALTPEQQQQYERLYGRPVRTVNDAYLAAEFLRQQMEPDEPERAKGRRK